MANFLQRFFKSREPANVERVEVMSGGPAYFTPFDGDAYSSDIYRAAVDAIARNAGKLKASHVITIEQQRSDGDSQLNRILQVRPNPFMSSYDLIYKITTHFYLYNNAFAYLQKDERGNFLSIWPLRPLNMEFLADPSGALFCRFLFSGGKTYIFPYSEIFHIRRHFNGNDLLGDPNTAIIPTLDLAHTQSQGMEAAIKSSAVIRGILKFSQVLAPEKLKAEKEAFINDYLTITNAGGIAVLDSKAEYTPLKNDGPNPVDDKQIAAIKQKVYEYLGISEAIVNSSYTEDQWAAFYESVIEPLAVQFSLELTDKLFTPREQAFGNSILFEANRLQFASNATKTNILKELMPLGLFTINQALEILNLPAVSDGDRRLQTLNVVNAAKADQYQLPNSVPQLAAEQKPSNGGIQNEGIKNNGIKSR
jgi:HK97 family phage portal protein